MAEDPAGAKPKCFTACKIIGGPHDGLVVEVAAEQKQLVFYDGTEPCRYHRVTDRSEFVAEDRLAAMFGGGQ